MRRVRVLVVDDHDLVRSGLRWLLRRAPWIESCVCARTTEEGLTLARSLKPDVALVDVDLGDHSGLGACAELRRIAPAVRIGLMSSRWDVVPRRVAREVGALGVISKEARARDLLNAVRRLVEGHDVDVPCPHPEAIRFLPSDREILRLVAAGLTNAEIGARLHLAPGTIKQHTGELYLKLRVHNRAGAVHAARRLGVIPPPATAYAPAAAGGPREPVRVLVADGADATRAGLMLALRDEPWVSLCHGADGGGDTLRIARRVEPDVALVGSARGRDGIVLSRALTAELPALRTVLVREHETPTDDVMRARASAVVLQSWEERRVVDAVRGVWAEEPERGGGGNGAAVRVSPREREVLRMLATGATNAEIARRLGLSPYTVKQHTSSIYRKLGVRNRAEAAGRAEALGLVGGAPSPERESLTT